MKRLRKCLSIFAVTTFCAAFLFPVAATIINSFMTEYDVRMAYFSTETYGAVRFIPDLISIEQYYILLIENHDYLALFWNSVKFTVIITFFHVFIALTTAYGFTKIRFRFRDALFFIVIAVMMMPFQVTLLPNFLLAKALGILYTDSAIILPGIFTPFGIFLMRQFMKTVPDETIEAITLESNSIVDIMRIAVIPVCKAGIAAVVILTVAEVWNMVEQPLVLLNKEYKYPLSVVLNSFADLHPDVAFAGSVFFMSPIMIVYFFFKESIYDGIKNMKF